MSEAVTIAIPVCKVQHYVHLTKLKMHPRNPRTIKPERLELLKESIKTKGFYQPILIWKKGGIILSGNHRFIAVQELMDEGYRLVTPDGKENMFPVVVEDVTEDMAMAILFESNNTYADWVEEKLRTALESAEEAGKNISSYGFTSEYVDALLKGAITEAESIVAEAKAREVEPVDATKLRAALAEEEFESLILPSPVYNHLVEILSKIAVAINEEWQPGDSLSQATQALCQSINESGIIEDIVEKIDET